MCCCFISGGSAFFCPGCGTTGLTISASKSFCCCLEDVEDEELSLICTEFGLCGGLALAGSAFFSSLGASLEGGSTFTETAFLTGSGLCGCCGGCCAAGLVSASWLRVRGFFLAAAAAAEGLWSLADSVLVLRQGSGSDSTCAGASAPEEAASAAAAAEEAAAPLRLFLRLLKITHYWSSGHGN